MLRTKFEKSRYDTWVTVSFKWMREEKDMMIPSRIQGLGLKDANLYNLNKFDIKNENGKPKVDEYDILIIDYININSYLWVLGVYELFRMIDQRLRNNEKLASVESRKAISEAKNHFNRIRVPLAKLEPARPYKNIDYPVPILGGDENQLGWQMNDDLIIYYRDLSDLAISTLRKLRPKEY